MAPKRQELKRPAVKDEKVKVKGLSSRRCSTILERVEKMCKALPKEAQGTLREAQKAAKKAFKSEDHEKSADLLGSVIAKAVKCFEEEMKAARDDFDKAKEAEQTVAAEQLEVETQLKDARQQVVDFKAKLKESTRCIAKKSQALAEASHERKGVVQELKLAEKEFQKLQHIHEKTYQPLREGSASRQQIGMLRRAGEKVGFHEELLSVAPEVLKKELTRRQTFDQLVLRSLDAEFSKKSKSLRSKVEENQQSLEDTDRVLDETKEQVLLAKETVKETSRKITESEALVESSRKSVSMVKKKAKSLPSVLKQVSRKFEQASGRYAKFRKGPLATFLTYRPMDDENEATERD